MALDTMDKVVAALAGGQKRDFMKSSATAEGAATWHSLWKAATIPPAGSNPPAFSAGSGYVPNDATTGAFPFTNNANTHLMQMVLSGATLGKAILYDRLWACSGLLTNTTSGQNVTTPGSLTRPDANGDGVELWGEVYTAPGATGATWTVVYTNQAGTGSRSATYTHPANAESVGQMVPFILQAGDTGVRSVQSFTCSVSSGTAGDIGLTLLRRVAEIPIQVVNNGVNYDFAELGMPRVYDDACLALMVLCTATNTGQMQGSFVLGQG